MLKSIDPNTTTKKLIAHIKAAFQKEHYADTIIGLSGGIDSTTSCTLAVRALGTDHVFPVLMPYGTLHVQGTKDARQVIEWLQIPDKQVRVVDIRQMVDATMNTLDSAMDDGRKGNVMARMRMAVLYDFAKAMPALVIGTENKTEHLLGYYTKFGDAASDIEPLRGLYKTQVYELARYLGVPKKIIEKSPTAGLWEGQTDEGEFGFTYKDVDEVLFLHFDKGFSKEEIIKRGHDTQLIGRIWWWIEKGKFKERLPVIFRKSN